MSIFDYFRRPKDKIPNPIQTSQYLKPLKEFSTLTFHKHPKILLVDIKDESEEKLKSSGFNVEIGTFGTPYPVEQTGEYLPAVANYNLPNYEEKEIIVIDLKSPAKIENTLVNAITENDFGFWGRCNLGFIDPRPIASYEVCQIFEKILSKKGIFIVFADMPPSNEIIFAQKGYSGLSSITEGFNLMGFLSSLNSKNFKFTKIQGTEIILENPHTAIGKLFNKYLNGTTFTCSLQPIRRLSYRYGQPQELIGYSNRNIKSWNVLGKNKFDEVVSGFFQPDENYSGWIFIFPQIADKANFLLEFVRDILSEIAPEIFPYSENKNWIQSQEYLPVKIKDLYKQIKQIETETQQKIEKIKNQIQKEKDDIEYQNKLLTDDGDSLVKAVEMTLKVLGFSNVINVDEEYVKQGKTDGNDEDLHILDNSENLLVEIKGVSGFPRDDDVFQVTKHIPIRMREWNKTNVKALSIINHQKTIPALRRENQSVFRDKVIESAEKQLVGLMTTFELYRLVRSFLKNKWKHENIKELFFQSGKISIIPTHYQYVGYVEKYWDKVEVVTVYIEENPIKVGDTIAFELPIEFEEMQVNSIQVSKISVETTEVSVLAGIKIEIPKLSLRKMTKVFRKITS